jgi:hypothetical protein
MGIENCCFAQMSMQVGFKSCVFPSVNRKLGLEWLYNRRVYIEIFGVLMRSS